MRNVRIRFTTITKAKQVNDTKDAAQTNQPRKKRTTKTNYDDKCRGVGEARIRNKVTSSKRNGLQCATITTN